MRELSAQVTSGPLHFPAVTVQALGEDEVTLDSVLHGRFTTGRSMLAWMACGPHLEVVHAATGERFSAYRFSGVTDHQQPTVTAVKEFSWLKRSGLLVGLQEDESSMLCLYDLGISRVIKAIVIPNRITAIEPLVSYGGASAHTQHLHQSLRWFFGVVAVVTDVGHVLLVDLCLDDLSCTQTELEASDLEVVNKAPGDIPRLREGVTQQGRHLCLQLCSPTGTGVSALHFISRTNQLAVGFTDGILQLWNMKSLKKEYHSQLEGGRVPVYSFTFQEPENDPRNCCYLWAVQSAQDLEGDVLSLHLLQLAFGERHSFAAGKIIYEGLEYCEERYSQDLCAGLFPLRAQATNTRLLSCQSIEKVRHHPDREESVNEVASPDTSVAVFSWQVKSYGQGRPSTYIGIFDINRWYHAQMPDSLRTGESLHNCPYLAAWSLDCVVEMAQSCPLLDVFVQERSLSRALPHSCPPPEQFYNPNTFNFDGSCLLSIGVVHFTCSGHQRKTLSYLKEAVPSLSDGITNGYSRCLMSGMLSSRLTDVQPSSLSEQEQLDAILSTAVETSALGLITGCIKQWSAEELAGSAGNLRYILQWAWDKVVKTKEELDSICAPLFDSSSNFTDPQTLQLLQHNQRSLSNLSTIFHCLLNQAQELTQQGVMGLMNKCMVSSLISQYAQVVLWFCRTGLLPESAGLDEDVLQISRPFYSFSIIKNYYMGQREELQRLAKDKWNADCLMIDGLVAQCGERLTDLWRRDEGGTGQYPPPSLHALLDLYLLENVDESTKHAIVIYLLLDVMYSFPNKSGASVESFPTAFSIPIGLVKLVQGLWLLDHHDHENSLDLLLHPSVSQCVWGWQHSRVLHALMIQNKHSTALQYLHMMKPSVNSINHIQLCLSVLLHNRCIVEAWSMLRQHVNKFSMEDLLRFFYETCQDLGLMKDLLSLPLRGNEQESLKRYLQGTGGFQNRELLMVHYLQQANYVPALQINQTLKLNLNADRDPKMKERSNTRNSIMNQYGKVLPRAQRKLAMERAKPYQHPSTIFREVSRPQPLSTVAKRSTNENVLSRAAFIKNVLTKIEEVWILKDTTPESPPLRSPKVPESNSLSPTSLILPEAFVGTPINMLNKRMSRLLEQAVQPSPQTSLETSRDPTTTTKPISSWAGPKRLSTVPELSLLQTPQVVKRARALAASTSVFSFTPQSILRSSLRPTPIATPTASPARSATPPMRSKESRITFMEELESPELNKNPVHQGNRFALGESSSLKLPSLPPEGGVEAWSEHSVEEEEEEKGTRERLVFSPALDNNTKPDIGRSKLVLPPLVCRPSLGHDTSQISTQSDSTLEFHDALSPVDISKNIQEENEIFIRCDDATESNGPSAGSELFPVQNPDPSVARKMETLPQDSINTNPHTQWLSNEDAPEIETMLRSSSEVFETQLGIIEAAPDKQNEDVIQEEAADQKFPEESNNLNFTTKESIAEESPNQQVGVPEKAIRSLEMSQEAIRETDECKSFEPPKQPITDHIPNETLKESLTRGSESQEPKQEHLLIAIDPIQELPATDSKELNNKADVMEMTDLDVYVEQHLFGNDVCPHQSVLAEPVSSDRDAGDKDSEAKSVCSSEATTSDSHSVVTLHDSEELSSKSEVEEDSGSEVEIIKEVKGNSISMEHQELYLQDQSPEDQNEHFLQEQTDAVLSLVSSDPQLQVMGRCEEEEGEVVVVRLRPVSSEENEVCYTELKPSTTLLLPVELAAEHQELLPAGSHDFSLMLEPDDDESTSRNYNALESSAHAQEEQVDGTSSETCVIHSDPGEVEHIEAVPSEDLNPAEVQVETEDIQNSNLEHQPDVLPEPELASLAEAQPELVEKEMDLKMTCGEDEEIFIKEPSEDPAGGADDVQAKDLLSLETKDDVESTNEPIEVVPQTALVTTDQNSEAETHKELSQSPVSDFELKEPLRSPGRRARKTVTFPLPEEEQTVPSTQRRITRSCRQLPNAEVLVTPRRSSRKTDLDLAEESVSVPRATPSRKTPQKATPKRGTRKTRSTSSEEEPEEPSTTENHSVKKTRKASSIEVPESIPEEKAEERQDDIGPSRVTRQSRRRLSLTIETLEQVSLQTVTPPRSRRKTRGAMEEKANNETYVVDTTQLQSVSRRLTRSHLWNNAEEPEKSESEARENPLASALFEQLQIKSAAEGPPITEIVRAKRRTRSIAPPSDTSTHLSETSPEEGLHNKTANESTVHARRRTTRATSTLENMEKQDLGSTEEMQLKNKPSMSTRKTSKVSEPNSSPVRDSFVFTSSLPKTRGKRKEDSVVDFLSPSVTRTRRTTSVPDLLQNEVPSNIIIMEHEDNVKKRTSRARAVPEPVQVNLLSPLASPAEIKEGKQSKNKETFSSKMNLRRKCMIESIYPKPVTRRKKL